MIGIVFVDVTSQIESLFFVNDLEIYLFLIVEELIFKAWVIADNIPDVVCFRVPHSDIVYR